MTMNPLSQWFRKARNSVTLSPKPLPEPEPLRAAPRPMTGFLSLLTADQREAALAYRGEDTHPSGASS